MLRVSKVWTFSIQIGFALAVVMLAGSFTRVQAWPCDITDVLPGGDGTLPNSALVSGFCVQSTDKLYGNWNLTALPAGGSVIFSVSATGSHSITFLDAFVDGNQYASSYEVAATFPNVFTQLSADITQTMGTSTLNVVTTPPGTPAITFVKNGNVVTGNFTSNYPTGPADLMVSNTLIPIAGSDASAILNTFIERAPTVPEPGTLELLGIGLTGLGVFGLRRKSLNRI